MATIQRVSQSSLGASPSNYCLSTDSGNGGGEAAASDQFPVGLRVLVVDDDTTCLRIIDQMLRRCLYHVTMCSQAAVALNLLREKKGCFDVVLSDVHMPDMDGYKLLEYVGLDLPVIMMSADKRTSAVMKGIRHGACDYLIKPIREEELKNIWQHVVRKKWNECKELENSESLEDNDKQMRGTDDAECASSAHAGEEGITRATRKRSSSKEGDSELENDDPTASKKPRVVWSVELHQQFVSAVNQLGLDKAVPKRILELMNVPGLTRENVASHLQKFRLYLKRLSGVAQQQNALPNIFCGSLEQNVKLDAFFGVEALAVSGQISPQTLAALHAELLGRSMCSLRPSMDQPAVLQGSLQGTKLIAVEHEPVDPFSQTLVKCQKSNSKNYSPSVMSADCVTSGYSSACPPNGLSFVGPNTFGRMSSQNANMLVGTLQQPQQYKQYEQRQEQKQHPQQPQQQLMSSEPSCSINVQPSCLVLPSHSSVNFLAGNIPDFSKHNHNINRGTIIDYSNVAPQTISLVSNFNQTDGDLNPHNAISGFLTQMSGSSVSCYSLNDANNSAGHVEASRLTSAGSHLPGVSNKKIDRKGFYGSKSEEMLDQVPFRNLVFVDKGSSSQSRSPVEEIVSPMTNEQLDHWKNSMPNRSRMKQDPLIKYVETKEVGIPIQKVHQ